MKILKSILVFNLFIVFCNCQDFKINNDKSGVSEILQKGDEKLIVKSQDDDKSSFVKQNIEDVKQKIEEIKLKIEEGIDKGIDKKIVIEKSQAKLSESEKNDGEDEIYRPCPNNDLECIRFFFASRSYCRVNYGKMPEEHFRQQTNLYYPLFGLSVTQVGTYSRGLNATVVKEFYVDKASDSIVLELQFTNFLLNSTLDIYRYHRPGKVDAITRSDSRIYLPSFTISTVFRGTFNIELVRSESTAFIETMGDFELNSSAGVHSDSIVSATFAKFSSSKLEVLKEGFLVLAPYYAGLFIQISICDFGLQLI